MAIELRIPQIGESITEVEIGNWLKAEGDPIARDEPLVELESEKATVELPSPVAGVLKRILKKMGEKAAIGEVIAELAEEGAKVEDKEIDAETPRRGDAEIKESPRPRVPASPRPGPPPPPSTLEPRPSDLEELVPMSPIRRRIAQRLVEAQHNAALLTTFNEIDMSAVQAMRAATREAFQKRHGVKLGLMSFFVKAVIDALKQTPQLNAEIRGDNIVYRNYCDIGIAVSGGKGLVVPVLRSADRMSFAQIERSIADLAERARDSRIQPDELAGGTFTITNGGVFGSLLSTPIVNPPQSGVLGMHAIQDRPVARDGQVVIRPMMYVALTYDHRIVDGGEAVGFLRRVKEAIESPPRMIIEA